MSGEHELELQEFAALEELLGPAWCVQVDGTSGEASGWVPSSSLACFNLWPPCLRLILEFPPDQIRRSWNREFFVETTLLFNESFSLHPVSMWVLCPSAVSLLCWMALVTPHLACLFLLTRAQIDTSCNKKEKLTLQSLCFYYYSIFDIKVLHRILVQWSNRDFYKSNIILIVLK